MANVSPAGIPAGWLNVANPPETPPGAVRIWKVWPMAGIKPPVIETFKPPDRAAAPVMLKRSKAVDAVPPISTASVPV